MRGRGAERVRINEEFASFAEFMREYVTDISESGAFIRTRTPLPVGTGVDLRFTVVMEQLCVVEGEGEVVRVSTDPPGMGVRFHTLTEESRAILNSLLEKTRGLAQVLPLVRR